MVTRLSHNPTRIVRTAINPSAARTERNILLKAPLPKPIPTLGEVIAKGIDKAIAYFRK